MPNNRSPRSNSGAVSSDDERGCAGGDASTGGVAAGLAAGAGVSAPAGVFGVTPPGGSRLATLGLAPGLAAAGLSGRRVAELPGLAIAGLSGTTAAGLPGMVPAGLSGTAAAGCGEGAVGAGSKAVAARPAVRSLAPPLAGVTAICASDGAGFGGGAAVATTDGIALSAACSTAGLTSRKAAAPASTVTIARATARRPAKGPETRFDCVVSAPSELSNPTPKAIARPEICGAVSGAPCSSSAGGFCCVAGPGDAAGSSSTIAAVTA